MIAVNFDYAVRMVDDGEPGEVVQGMISMPSDDREAAEQRVIDLMLTEHGYRSQDILRIDLEQTECEHVDFDEWMDGSRRCLGCGKEVNES